MPRQDIGETNYAKLSKKLSKIIRMLLEKTFVEKKTFGKEKDFFFVEKTFLEKTSLKNVREGCRNVWTMLRKHKLFYLTI